MATVVDRFYGTGRRKTSVARVWIRPGSGRIVVNRRDFADYFPRETLRMIIAQPFQVTSTEGQFDVLCTVVGGGPTRPGRRGPSRAGAGAGALRREAAVAAQEGGAPHARPAHARAQEVRPAGRAAEVPVLQALSDVASPDRIRVAVAGASGYMGAELLRLLLRIRASRSPASPRSDWPASRWPRRIRTCAGSPTCRSTTSTPAGWPTSPTWCSWRCRTWSRSARCRCCAARGCKVDRPLGRLPAARPAGLRHVVQGAAHRPGRAGRGGVRAAGAASQGDRGRVARRLAGLLSDGRDPGHGAAGEERPGPPRRHRHRRQVGRDRRRRAGTQDRSDVPLHRGQRERAGLRDRLPSPHAGDRAGAVRAGGHAGAGELHAAPGAAQPRAASRPRRCRWRAR